MVIKVSANLKKMELEKNNFIKKLSREQFDGVLTNKYKKIFHEYFNGTIGEVELAKRVESALELIAIYEDGENGKIDTNQYLYSASVDVALDYFNVANAFESLINKMYLVTSYFQLCAIAKVQLEYLEDLIYTVFFVNASVSGDGAGEFLDNKLDKIKNAANTLGGTIGEISKHEDVIAEVEKSTGTGFCDESLLDESIKEMYVMFKNSASSSKAAFTGLVEDCVDNSNGAKLDIMHGKLL